MTMQDANTDGQGSLGFSTEYRRIAVEEAWAPPRLLEVYRSELEAGSIDDPGAQKLWGYYLGTSERARRLVDRIVDAGPDRIQAMDEAGLDVQILSLTAPGVQALRKEIAAPMAEEANNLLKQSVDEFPDRFRGLTAVAPQDPKRAAAEVVRGHDELGFNGVIINSHTHGEYLDDQKFWPILEAAEGLDTPIYLHPRPPEPRMLEPYAEVGLEGAIFGFAADTGLHLLRMITGGVFDQFPDLKVVVGHLGEALPFWMWRIDFMHDIAVGSNRHPALRPLAHPPSHYLKTNVWYTTSGMPWAPAVTFVREVVGKDRLMFAWDYPYQWSPQEVASMDALPWTTEDKADFFQRTAEQVFHLNGH